MIISHSVPCLREAASVASTCMRDGRGAAFRARMLCLGAPAAAGLTHPALGSRPAVPVSHLILPVCLRHHGHAPGGFLGGAAHAARTEAPQVLHRPAQVSDHTLFEHSNNLLAAACLKIDAEGVVIERTRHWRRLALPQVPVKHGPASEALIYAPAARSSGLEDQGWGLRAQTQLRRKCRATHSTGC